MWVAVWASFRESLNSQFQNQSDRDVIISAADDAFIKFKLWIEKMTELFLA
jgi:heme oxygenase